MSFKLGRASREHWSHLFLKNLIKLTVSHIKIFTLLLQGASGTQQRLLQYSRKGCYDQSSETNRQSKNILH